MWQNRNSWFAVTTFGIALGWFAYGDEPRTEKMYVHAVKVQLRAEPIMTSPTVVELKRGQVVNVLEKKSNWYSIASAEKKGWVSRLFLSEHKPVGQADLLQDLPTTLEKSNRKRSSGYGVSAAARGLTTTERSRGSQEKYRSDFEALEALEKYSVDGAKLDNFAVSAKIDVE